MSDEARAASPFDIDPTVTREDLIAALRSKALDSHHMHDGMLYWCRLCTAEWRSLGGEWHRNTCVLRAKATP